MTFHTPELDTIEQEQALELCNRVLAGLTRSDQRRTGLEYVLGLLAARGRKTVRGIASCEKVQTAHEQRLHHFISRSTWSARDVLTKLVDVLQAQETPSGWVIRPMVVEKHGDKTVGVKNEVVPCLGRAINHQHVLATWFTGERVTVPVDWRLVVPEAWTSDETKRTRARIPVRVDSPTSSDAAAALVRALRPRDTGAPVVMDARETDVARVIAAAQARSLPYLFRIRGSTIVAITDERSSARTVSTRAQRLAEAVRSQGRPVPGPVLRTARRTPVLLPTSQGPIATQMVSVWSKDAGWAGVWLTDLELDLDQVVRVGDLLQRADQSFTRLAQPLGAVDYEGRSYDGWHHHMAMVSVAHAVRAQVLADESELSCMLGQVTSGPEADPSIAEQCPSASLPSGWDGEFAIQDGPEAAQPVG